MFSLLTENESHSPLARRFFKPSSELRRLAALHLAQDARLQTRLMGSAPDWPSTSLRHALDYLRAEGLLQIKSAPEDGLCHQLTGRGREVCGELMDEYCAEVAQIHARVCSMLTERLEDLIFHEHTRVAVFGTGAAAEFLLKALERFPEAHVAAIVDSNPAKIGTIFSRHVVLNPCCLRELLPDVVIAASWGSRSRIIDSIADLDLPDTVKVAAL